MARMSSLSPTHIGVSTTPGANALTVIPCSISPRAVACVTARTPNFATQYGTKSQKPCLLAIEPVLMILPPDPWAIICFAASCVQTITPQVFTRTICSKFSSSTSMKPRGRLIPALLKITLSSPNLSTAFWIIARTSARSVTSTPTESASPPPSTMIRPPSAAIARHAAAPIPPAPPVTTTTRPSTRPMSDGRGLALEEIGAADVCLPADEELLGRELRDHSAARGRHDHFLLDSCCRFAVARGAVGLECEDHALLDLDRVVERVHAGDHRRLVEADPEPVPELQSEARLLVREAELLPRRPHARDLIRRRAGADEVDRVVEPLTALLVRVDLRGRDTADVERSVVARPVAHEGVDDVEERLIARPEQSVREHVRVRVAAVSGDGVDRLALLRAELEEDLHRARHDLVLAHAGPQHSIDLLVDGVHDGSRMLEQRDLLFGFDRARLHHHRLRVRRLDALTLQGVQRLHIGEVDAERVACDAALLELAVDS